MSVERALCGKCCHLKSYPELVSWLIIVDVYSRIDFKTFIVRTEIAGDHDRDDGRVKQ